MVRFYAGTVEIFAKLSIDHTQILTAQTRHWCDQQWALLERDNPRSNEFITRDRTPESKTFIKLIPPWYQQLVNTARNHHFAHDEPYLSVAEKPLDGYAGLGIPRREVQQTFAT